MTKKYLIPMAAVAFIGATVYGVAHASAADASNDRHTLIQKIADKFNVDKAKVQEVFDEHKSERQAEHAAKYEERLNQAVTDGKLTAEQRNKLISKHQELKVKMDAAMEKTGTERREAMSDMKDEATAWAESNGIEAKWLMAGGGRGHGKHGEMDGGRGMSDGPRQSVD